MVRIIQPKPPEYADAPGTEPSLKTPLKKLMATCPHCLKMGLTDYTAEFTGLYVIQGPQGGFRIYYCNRCTAVFLAKANFKRCNFKKEIVEYDSHGGLMHWCSCMEPNFRCVHARRDLPTEHWFCQILDQSPNIKFMDVYNDPWFYRMKRQIIPEDDVTVEGVRKWIQRKVVSKR